MGRSKLSKALFAGALALSASSVVPARSFVFVSEGRNHVTFSDAIVDTTANRVSFDRTTMSMGGDGRKVFGELPHATSLFVGMPAAVDGGLGVRLGSGLDPVELPRARS